ncbi:MAG TPA: Arc family DNA-binding protein [Thermoanaerobaculia bacterium]|nr:Arc family DNA-binding protein [Thermoanaerobaculia bacterium]
MATLHLSIPEALYEQIRQRAEAHGRSIGVEVVDLLTFALANERPSAGEVLEEIRRRRSFRPSAVGAPDSTTLLREDRAR